jgi:hypothetical protein
MVIGGEVLERRGQGEGIGAGRGLTQAYLYGQLTRGATPTGGVGGDARAVGDTTTEATPAGASMPLP